MAVSLQAGTSQGGGSHAHVHTVHRLLSGGNCCCYAVNYSVDAGGHELVWYYDVEQQYGNGPFFQLALVSGVGVSVAVGYAMEFAVHRRLKRGLDMEGEDHQSTHSLASVYYGSHFSGVFPVLPELVYLQREAVHLTDGS